ncbi:unnamed protein product [Schistosoma turkestanicum]|nr:unnamed protein product [Schistosoma turkestanicum]
MENGRNTNLRSLVRPVSPLSRWQKPPLPVDDTVNHDTVDHDDDDDDRDDDDRRLGRKRFDRRRSSRSRSPPPPALYSSVHLATTDSTGGIELKPSEETRRIIVRRPLLHDTLNDDYTRLNTTNTTNNTTNNDEDHSNHTHRQRRRRQRSRDERSKKPLSRSLPFMKHRPLPPIVPSGIDRENTCPMLLRLFYSTNARHYSLSDYNKGRTPENEIQFNTWIDATLAELADELRHVVPMTRRRGTRMHFAIVYPDSRGTYGRRQLGVVITGYGLNSSEFDNNASVAATNRNSNNIQRPSNLIDDSCVTLLSKKFQIGDYVDCAIVEYTPGSLVGWSSGRRPLGPPPPPTTATTTTGSLDPHGSSKLEESRMI